MDIINMIGFEMFFDFEYSCLLVLVDFVVWVVVCREVGVNSLFILFNWFFYDCCFSYGVLVNGSDSLLF